MSSLINTASVNQGRPQLGAITHEIKNATAAKEIYRIVNNFLKVQKSSLDRSSYLNSFLSYCDEQRNTIVKVQKSSLDRSSCLNSFLSYCDEQENTIRSLIIQRLSVLDKGSHTIERINILTAYLLEGFFVQPDLLKRYYDDFCFPIYEETRNSLSEWIKDSSKPDFSKEDVKTLVQRIPGLSNYFYYYFRYPLYLEFRFLSTSQNLHSPFTGFKIKANSKGNCPHSLLHYAIRTKKINIAHYLLIIGANSNTVDKEGKSAIMKSLQSIFQENFDASFPIFSHLLEHRKPIKEMDLFHLLDLCHQQYKPNNPSFNLHLFDWVISLLLGCRISTEDYFKNDRELFLKYVAHVHEIKGFHKFENATGVAGEVELESLDRDEYVQFRLRLLLQMIIEGVHQGKFSTQEFSLIYKEFLLELEMGWISQLLDNWRKENCSKDEEKTKGFCDCLSHYVFKQIICLESGKEYPLHVGWPGHSICVVFAREENENLLTIRIDNLGDGCDRHSKNKQGHVQSKILRQYDIVNENGSTEIKEVQQNVGNQIKSYLSSLFFNVCFAYSDDMIPKLIENVYNPALPSISPNNTSSQVTEIFSLLKNGKATSFTEEYDPESPSISPNNTINRPLTDLFSLLKNREPTSISEEYDPESRLISSNNIPHQLTDLLSLLKNREPTSISEEYDPQSLSISSQLNKDLFYPEQIVGNCTFASFSVGVRRRLKDDVFDKVLRGESSVFTSIGKMHNQGQIQLEIPPQAFRVQIEAKQNHFSSRLKDHLKNIYQNFLPKENFFYIMRPTIQDGNSYWYSNKKNGEDLGQWIDELFLRKQDEESTLRILIEGRAGLGKTIFSKQFSLEWHQNKPGVVIYLLLRNLSNEQRYPADKMYTVIDVIEKELYGKSFNDLERRLLVYELNRKETIWVVDGLDELHVLPQLKEAVKELMGKKKLIVTSRPGIEQHLQGQVDTDFQWCLFLQDYSEKEIHLFIDAYFSGSDSSLNSKEKIKQAIEKNKQLKELCSIPLTLNVICQLVKQGNEDVLVKENIAELYSCCIVAHLREAYKRQTNMDIHVPDSNIRGFYKTAVRFMELLAYESLQQYRNVFVSKEIVEGVLNLQGIDQHLDKQSLFEQLKAIGLVEVTPFGTEFIHATFQEYFAACFLIKSLKKSKKTKTYKDAQAFMEKHSYNFSYESLFSFMIQQLLFLISQEKEETTKKKLMGLLSNAVSNFAPPRLDNPRYVFLMGISMLNAYAKGIKSKAFTEEDLIEEHGDFIGAALQYILHCEFSDSASVREASNTLIPFIKLSGGIDDQFATLFLTVPILKKRYNIYTRLFKNIQVDSSKVLLMTWKTIFFIQSIKEFNEQTIHDVHQIAFRIQNKTVQADLFRGLLELTLNWIEEIVSQQTLSDGDVGRLKSLTTSLDEQLKALSQIVTGKPFELTMVGKIIHCLKILLAQQDRSSAIQEIVATIKNYLPDYVLILFSSLNLKSIAEHCRHLTFLKSLGLSLSSIFSEKTIQPLTEEMDKCLEEVKKTGETTSCIKSLEKVDYILQHFLRILIIVDFVAPAYREKYLEVLPELYKSRSASFFYKDYTKEERKKLLLWLESLAQRDELFQYEEWIRDFCKELRNSIYDFQNGLSGIPKNSAISFCESDSENRPLSKFALVEKKDNFCADLPGNFEGISKDMAEKLNVKDVKNCHFNEQMEFQKRPNEPSSRLNDFMIAESLSNFLSPTSSEKSLSNSIPSFFEDRQLDEKEIARYLWLNPDTLISPSTLRKVNKVSVYLRRKRLELRGVKADGNCFCYAFLGSYETLNRKIPILDEQKDKISYLRDIIAQEYAITEKGSDYKGRQRVEGIKEDKEWLTGDEGDLLAISLSIPIRIITINEEKGHSQIFDMLTFTEKNKDRQEWKTIPESEKPKEYITIVDLGGHFVYAVPCSTDLNSENAQREKLQSSY